ncbi:MAG TPA: PAS domain-containing protein, partial [Rhizomicrobium sp.]
MANTKVNRLEPGIALARSEFERSFELLRDLTSYAIYLLDADGVIVGWNAGAELIVGHKAEEMIGEPFSRLFTKEERRAGVPRQALFAAKSAGRYENEGWQQRKDGNHLWANTTIEAVRDEELLIGYACITRDATEKRAAEEALRESERQFRLLVAGVTDYALFMLDPNGIVSSWNAGAERIKGYRANEIIGHHFSRFFTDVDRGKGTPLRALYTATQEGRFEAEGWRVRRDGSLFWANAIIDAIRDE